MGKRYQKGNYCPEYWTKIKFYFCGCGFFKTKSFKKLEEHSKICMKRKKENKCVLCGDEAKAKKETGKCLCWGCFNNIV